MCWPPTMQVAKHHAYAKHKQYTHPPSTCRHTCLALHCGRKRVHLCVVGIHFTNIDILACCTSLLRSATSTALHQPHPTPVLPIRQEPQTALLRNLLPANMTAPMSCKLQAGDAQNRSKFATSQLAHGRNKCTSTNIPATIQTSP